MNVFKTPLFAINVIITIVVLAGCSTGNKDNVPVTGAMYYDLTPEALNKLTQDANGGDAAAALRLSLYYNIAKDDLEKGFEYLKKSAELGLPQAQYDLGIEYSYVDQIADPEKYRFWMEKSAQNGNQDAIDYIKNHQGDFPAKP